MFSVCLLEMLKHFEQTNAISRSESVIFVHNLSDDVLNPINRYRLGRAILRC